LHEVSELECVCCSCETDAVCRPPARPFVQDAQSGMRLPESGSRLRLDPLSGSRMPLCASRTNGLAATRRTASVAQLQQTHDSSVTSVLHSPSCPKILRSSYAHSPPLLLSSPGSRLAWLPATLRHASSRNGTESRGVFELLAVHVLWLCSVFTSSLYTKYASLNGALGLDDIELLSAKQIRLTGEFFCEWRACLPESVSFAACYFPVCSICKFVLYFCFIAIFCTFCGPFY